MPIDILMPALSPTMEEGTLAKWLKKEGDTVKSGDVIAEIETDKATMEVEAVDEGTIGKILVAEGTEDVKVNTPIARARRRGRGRRAPRRRHRAEGRQPRRGREADGRGEGRRRPQGAGRAPAAPRRASAEIAADPAIPGRHRDGRR